MNRVIIWTIFCKEILDTLRDKRTLVAMVGVPIVLYPALVLLLSELAISQSTRVAAMDSRIAIVADQRDPIADWFTGVDNVVIAHPSEPDRALASGEIDVVVRVAGSLPQSVADRGTLEITLEFDTTESASRLAIDRVQDVLNDREGILLKQRLQDLDLPETFTSPFKITFRSVEEDTKRAGFLLGSMLPIIVVLMMALGGFYPAVDLTAGEKERGTFETLLSTPATKLDILAGKFAVVLVLALITGLLNVLSSGLTLWIYLIQLSQIGGEAVSELSGQLLSIPPGRILLMILMLLPLAFIISALMMSVALFARSFKDAQNYLTPLFIGITIPAVIGAVPDVELTAGTRFIPIGNVMLLTREIMMDQAILEDVFFVLISTVVYALAAFLFAAKVFQSEEVILSQERGIPFSLNRSLFVPDDTPTPGLALGIFAVVMVAVMYLGSVAQTFRPLAGLAFTEYVLVLAPVLLILWFTKIRFATALNLRPVALSGVAGSLLMATGWIWLNLQINVFSNRLLPPPPEIEKALLEIVSIGETLPGLLLLLLLIALTPAICEEALFRGTLLSGLRGRLPDWAAVLAIGLLFGLFHLSIYRFLPTATTGIVLTYLALRGGSILLPALFHACFNGTLVLLQLGYCPQWLTDQMEATEAQGGGVPATLLAAGGIMFVAGIALIRASARGNPKA